MATVSTTVDDSAGIGQLIQFTPFIMLTAGSQTEKKQAGKAAGASGWIVAPFKTEQLVDVVKKSFTPPENEKLIEKRRHERKRPSGRRPTAPQPINREILDGSTRSTKNRL